jgi:Tfp pilus assembly protein PilN
MPTVASSPGGRDRRGQPLQGRRPRWLAAALIVVLAFGLGLLVLRTSTARLLAQKEAELERKERELQTLVESVQPAPEAEAALRREAEAAAELAEVLGENERRQKRLAQVLGRLGPAAHAGIEIQALRLGEQVLGIGGCAVDARAVAQLVAALEGVEGLDPLPRTGAAAGEIACADPAQPHPFELEWELR